MKIVIVGGGKVGEVLCHELTSEANDIILIDKNPVIVERMMNKFDIMGIVGNGVIFNKKQELRMQISFLLYQKWMKLILLQLF